MEEAAPPRPTVGEHVPGFRLSGEIFLKNFQLPQGEKLKTVA